MTETYAIYKPFGMLSQFTREAESHITLADLGYKFAQDVYPVGRLDSDSEGLLILSNDKSLNQRMLHPTKHVKKTYWVQVEGEITEDALAELSTGVALIIDKKTFHTQPAEAYKIAEPALAPRIPPIRFRANIPSSWLSLQIHEGKNRQVRRMTAAVGFPTLRLVRYAIGAYTLADMQVGEVRKLTEKEIQLLFK